MDEAPEYPEGFEPDKGNKIEVQIKNEGMLEDLNEVSPGIVITKQRNSILMLKLGCRFAKIPFPYIKFLCCLFFHIKKIKL